MSSPKSPPRFGTPEEPSGRGRLPRMGASSRGARSIQRIVDAAARLFGREGFQGASMHAVARAAGVSKGLLHYHFQSKEHLVIEAQRATFRQLHRRFDDRFQRGERGLGTALEALDALYGSVREMRAFAPFMVETMSLVTHGGPLAEDAASFYDESMELLINGIRRTFEGEEDRMSVPPERLANLVRIGLHGLIVELAYAQTEEDLAVVDRAFQDLRGLFARVALRADAPADDSSD